MTESGGVRIEPGGLMVPRGRHGISLDFGEQTFRCGHLGKIHVDVWICDIICLDGKYHGCPVIEGDPAACPAFTDWLMAEIVGNVRPVEIEEASGE